MANKFTITLKSGEKISSQQYDTGLVMVFAGEIGEDLRNIEPDSNFFIYSWWRNRNFQHTNSFGTTYFHGSSIESIRILK